MGNVQEQQDMKERRKQQNICESCFEEHQLVFLAPCGCSTICRDCAMQISLCPSIGCGKEITRICSTRGELETAVTQLEERAARRKRQRKFPVVMDDVEKSVAVPAADSTVALTDEEKHILERLKGSFLFQQPLYPIETVECRGLDDEQTDHSHRHPFMTSWTAVRGLNFDMLYFRWHFGNWRLTQP